MAKKSKSKDQDHGEEQVDKPLVWLAGEIKTPPFTVDARQEAGFLLRMLQHGQTLGMPHSKSLTDIGPRCAELRVRDEDKNWRIIYRVDSDAIVIAEVFAKKTEKLPKTVIDRCKKRFAEYDDN